MYIPEHFDLAELTCPHVYYRFGRMAWQFFDEKMLITLDWVRERLGPVYVNNWHWEYLDSEYVKYIKARAKFKLLIHQDQIPISPGQLFDERGIRCNLCSIAVNKTLKGQIYVSPHFLGKGVDFDVKGKTALEVREYLVDNKDLLPFPIRLEAGVSWVHMDSEEDIGGNKVYVFNP